MLTFKQLTTKINSDLQSHDDDIDKLLLAYISTWEKAEKEIKRYRKPTSKEHKRELKTIKEMQQLMFTLRSMKIKRGDYANYEEPPKE
jgi:hypothetical protein